MNSTKCLQFGSSGEAYNKVWRRLENDIFEKHLHLSYETIDESGLEWNEIM